LTVEDVLQLMLAAAEHRCEGALTVLCEQGAAHDLSSGALAEVLVLIVMQQSFVPKKFFQSIRELSASYFSHEQIAQIFKAAVQNDSHDCMQEIWKLPAADGLGNPQIMLLLETAVQLGYDECAMSLCSVLDDAQEEIDSAQVVQLLMSAAEHGSSRCMEPLGLLPAAEQLNSTQLAQLITAAVRKGDSECVAALCALHAAGRIALGRVAELLRLAVTTGSVGCTEVLCHLPVAQQLSCTEVWELMLAAVEHGDTSCMLQLCWLPAARRLDGLQVARLLKFAVGTGGGACAELLCRLPAAAELDVVAVAQLLQAAKRQGCAGCLEHLRRLHTPAEVDSVGTSGWDPDSLFVDDS
jgi:hypothetical protein